MVTTAGRRTRAALAGVAAFVAIGAWSTGVAGAAITAISTFDLSPTSGPPGTIVNFAGTACSPGLTRSAASDYVAITAPAFQISMQAPVTDNGSWHGSFTVPSDAPTGLPSLVLAHCFSDGWPSITTIYTAQTFTVTAPSPTTASTTPTTKPNGSGDTTPPTNGEKPDPDGSDGSTVPAFGGFPPDNSGGNRGGSANGGSATTRAAIEADVSRATHRPRAARAADLSVPALPAGQVAGAGGLGWLAWLLVLVLVVSAVGAPFWLRRSRRSKADAIGDGA